MSVFNRNLRSTCALWCAGLLLAACETTTLTPTFRTAETLERPDRVLIYDFAVSPAALENKSGLDPEPSRGSGSEAQTQQEIQEGKAFAKALSANLLQELRGRGIDASSASETSPPGANTASIKGSFLRVSRRGGPAVVGFGLDDGQVRTRIQIFRGTGLSSGLVAEAETVTQPDAKIVAREVAEKIADYYRRRGWIK